MARNLALLVACGCGRIGFDPFGSGMLDAPTGDAIVACTTWSPWSTPQLISELMTTEDDWEPALSNDGQTLVFTRSNSTSSTLYISQRAGTTWGTPATIPALDLVMTSSFGPAWGSASIYFTNDGSGSDVIYVSSAGSGTFGAPAALPELPVSNAVSPTVSTDELEMFYTEVYGPPTGDSIRRATRAATTDKWTDLGRVAELQVTAEVGWPTLSGDGLTLYFEADSSGGSTIYVATRAQIGGTFSTPVLVPELDSSHNNGDPELSRDGTTMLFASDRTATTDFDMYVATRTCN